MKPIIAISQNCLLHLAAGSILLGTMVSISSGLTLTVVALIRIADDDALFREGSQRYFGPD